MAHPNDMSKCSALLPPLLSLPKPSAPLLGAVTSPTSSQTSAQPELPAALPGPAKDDEGHDATLSAPLPASHQLTPLLSALHRLHHRR